MPNDDDKDLPSLDKLEASIDKLRKKEEEANGPEATGDSTGMGGLRIGVELVAGVLVGILIGYFLDKWLDTKPVFFLICFTLGVLGAGMNIYRVVQQDQKKFDNSVEKQDEIE